MNKNEFVMIMLANNLNLFSNASLVANVRDMIKTAQSIYDVVQQEMGLEEVPQKLRQAKK